MSQGTLGYGLITDADGYLSTATNNNYINLTLNLTDTYTLVNNVTFNMTNLCNGVVITQTSAPGGLWWANCSLDANGLFQYYNIKSLYHLSH